MTQVELVLTDTRIWARGPSTHWDGVPSVVLGGNGSLVVGEPLTPLGQVSSAVQFVAAERIALLPRVPELAEALSALFATVLDNLGLGSPCERFTIVCPTEWGGHRRETIATAARRFAGDIVFEPIAARSVATDEATLRARRVVVLEFGALTTTAATVVRTHDGAQVESCEYEPDLALDDLGADPGAAEGLAAMLERLLDGGRADLVQVFGASDPAKLDLIDQVAHQVCGADVEVRPVSGVDLLHRPEPRSGYIPDPVRAMPDTEWLQPLRQRAAARAPERNTVVYAAAAAAVVVLAAAAVGAVVAFSGSDDSQESAAAPTTSAPATSAPISARSTSAAPRTSTAPSAPAATETLGRITFRIPDGWRVTSSSTQSSRVDLAPEDGSRLRLTIIQTAVAPDAGYARIAADLEAQMREKPSLGALRRDVVFAGRSGLSYIERPEGGSTVRWHVLLEHATQVSVGCQYVADIDWATLEPSCEELAASIDVQP
ncbi:type VII secretion-associated protein [Nocardia shimofusensis]|uniref:type VII secretion-associated protein n=1 Tax=Nocardia shimofusensis TaxID=228596 RepID=UPI0008316425|nr:type VII secretion-associated protein [Nocardia shimofusensis]